MASDFSAGQFASANTCGSAVSCSRWLTEEVFKLIDIVQRDEAIYNPRHKYYFCRPYVENFWREVDLKLEKNPGASLAKWTNLRISFRREYTNYLEEKVPPCWSYFDRMFFLHPYLRKKHQQAKSLDTQVQDALAHLSSLSSRMQRERPSGGQMPPSGLVPSPPPQQLDNYLDYFDEHEHNNSELDDLMDEEQRARFQNDIKSECEEPVEDYEHETEAEQRLEDAETEAEPQPEPVSSCNSSSSTAARYSRMQRLQLRTYQEEPRGLRPRSQELQCQAPIVAAAPIAQAASNLQPHSNISFVRPTFTSKPVDVVSTTTHNGAAIVASEPPELPTPSSQPATATPSSVTYLNPRHGHVHVHHPNAPTQRLDLSNSSSAAGAELCDCKTDSDAMFLMSLLPDIQKLNGRDRGKIKIAFQNILQDYLYPD